MRITHALSANGYREVALLKLQADVGLATDKVIAMWKLITKATRRYKGYKHGFGRIIQREMKVRSLRLWNYPALKAKLIAEGKHQSQNTIVATGLLVLAAPPSESRKRLDRTECVLRLLLATPPSEAD